MLRRRKRVSPFGAPQHRRHRPPGSGTLGGPARRRRASPTLILLGVLVGLGLAYVYHRWSRGQAPAPVGTGTPAALVDPAREAALARDVRAHLLLGRRVEADGAFAGRTREVVARLTADLDEAGGEWSATVVDAAVGLAVALPDRSVLLSTPVSSLVLTDDELAVLLAHQIAHATARHGAARLPPAASRSGELDVETRRLVAGAFGVGAPLGVLLPFSPADEAAADERGLALVARACFDPGAAGPLWERIAGATDPRTAELRAVHPMHPERRAALAGRIAAARTVRPARCADAAPSQQHGQ